MEKEKVQNSEVFQGDRFVAKVGALERFGVTRKVAKDVFVLDPTMLEFVQKLRSCQEGRVLRSILGLGADKGFGIKSSLGTVSRAQVGEILI